MCCRRLLFAAAGAMAALAAGAAASAQTVVTACGTDTAAGGVNLAGALGAGGDVVIRCADGADTIQLTGTRTIYQDTTLDGEGRVSIMGPGDGPMFVLDGPRTLRLRGLTLRNPPTPPDPGRFTGVVYDPADWITVELENVTVADTRLPFVVRRFTARNSTLSDNGDPANPDIGVVMAGELELDTVVFRDNASRPFHAVWREDPTVSGQRIAARVVDSVFERNARPAFWGVGEIVVLGSRFEGNGGASYVSPPAGALYGGAVYLELAPSRAGALEIFLGRAQVSRSVFLDNQGTLGGAIYSLGGALTLQSSDLDRNRATSGGAVAFLSPTDLSAVPPPRLELRHVKARDNAAARHGGAVLLSGAASADAVLFSANSAGEAGGAVAMAGPAATAAQAEAIALAGPLPATAGPSSTTSFEATRAFFLDNTAQVAGAIEAGGGSLRLGDALVSRNTASAPGGAALQGPDIELANVTIVGNAGGVAIPALTPSAAGLSFTNVILADNAGGNCLGALDRLAPLGPNLQFPGAECGAGVAQAAPALDARFAPTGASPARDGGSTDVCASHDLVNGRDLYGDPRPAAACAIGAVEADRLRDLKERLPLGFGEGDNWRWLLLLLLAFFLFWYVVGLVLRGRARGRHGAQRARG